MARSHREIDDRSIALHGAVAELLRRDPSRLAEARQRVAGWRREGTVALRYVEAWEAVLDGPFSALLALLTDPDEAATAMRQVSPFAGFLAPRERWEILRRHGLRA